MTSNLQAFPPAPWRLRGEAILRVQALPLERVRQFVPPELSVVPVWPGRTLGGLFVARYGGGSTRQYHELMVIPALVRRGRRVGGWVSHIYVDDLQSLAAGRHVWGLPKQAAQFSWQSSEEGIDVRMSASGLSPLCAISAQRPNHRLQLPVRAPALTRLGVELLAVQGRGWARTGLGNCDIRISHRSPFASLDLSSGRYFQLDDFNLLLPEPLNAGRFS